MKLFFQLLILAVCIEACQMESAPPVDFSKEVLDSLIVRDASIVDSSGLQERQERLFKRLRRITGLGHGHVVDDSGEIVIQALFLRKSITFNSEYERKTDKLPPCFTHQWFASEDEKERNHYFFSGRGWFDFNDVVFLEEFPQGDFYAIVENLTYRGELTTLFYSAKKKVFYADGDGGLLPPNTGRNFTTIRFSQTQSKQFLLYLAETNSYPISPVPDDMCYADAKMDIITADRRIYNFYLADIMLDRYAKDAGKSLDDLEKYGTVRDSLLQKMVNGAHIYSNIKQQVELSFPLKKDTARYVLNEKDMTFYLK